MSIEATFVLPHPPIAVPEVGKGEEGKIAATVAGFEKVAQMIAEIAPDTIVVVSPHSTSFQSYIHIAPGNKGVGNFEAFGVRGLKIEKPYDKTFVKTLEDTAQKLGLSAGTHKGNRFDALDHGITVPLYFIDKEYSDYKLVRCGISGLNHSSHYEFGRAIKMTAEELGLKTVVIGSGDLSHKLTESGPYGFAPDAPIFDERIVDVLRSADFGELFDFDEDFCEAAAQCGLRSFLVMAGALDGMDVEHELFSYEGPFGVGYATAFYIPTTPNPYRKFDETHALKQKSAISEIREKEDVFVRLARLSAESFIADNVRLTLENREVQTLLERAQAADESDGVQQLLSEQSGAFVSIKRDGMLRGCIGTIGAVQESLAQEILTNAVSSVSEDPRFPLVGEAELQDLVYSVDVLGAAEPIEDVSQLDVKRYGVIVTSGRRRGLLLPDLAGIDTPEEQVFIAMQKAGILPEDPTTLERFEVIRHT